MADMEVVKREEQAAPAIRREGDHLANIQRLGNLLAASGYFADAREMAQAAVKVMAGEELGIPPIASMMGINIIKGKVALSGNLIASRIRAHGYEFVVKQMDAHGCVLHFLGKPDAEGKRRMLGASSFTEEDAKAAGLLGSDMYKKYPRNMYFNRTISNGAKWYTPEVTNGAPVYTPEELGATVDEDGNMIHPEPPRETQQQVAERRIAEETAKASAPEPVKSTPAITRSDFTKLRVEFLSYGAAAGAEYDRVMVKYAGAAGKFPPTATKARECHAEMLQVLESIKGLMQAETPAPKPFQATDEDLPAEMRGSQE
jgi:hypothetical protein